MRSREVPIAAASFDRIGAQVPGYTGHVPGQRYIYASTYGKAARAAIGDELVPARSHSSPATKLMPNSSKVSVDHALTHQQVAACEDYHVPGYTGHVHGDHHMQSKTYGQTTRHLLVPSLKATEPALPNVYSDSSTAGRTVKDVEPAPTLGRAQKLTPVAPKTPSEVAGHSFAKADLTRARQLPEVTKSGWVMRKQPADLVFTQSNLQHGVADTGARNSTNPSAETARWEALLDTQHVANGQYRVPGYTGHVHGREHVFAKTYGETSRILLNSNRDEFLPSPGSPAPSYPSPVASAGPSSSLSPIGKNGMAIYPGGPVAKNFKIPGYMGYVHGSKDVYAKTFGTMTREVSQPPPKTVASMSTEQYWLKEPHPHKGAHRSSNVYYKQSQLSSPARNCSDVILGDESKYPSSQLKSTYDTQHAIQSDKHVVKRPHTWQQNDVNYPKEGAPPKYFPG